MARRRERDGDLESLLHFSRRKFCDMKCMARGFTGRFKAGVTNPSEGRYRARTIKRRIQCESCGRRRCRLDVHHLDENPLNNELANLTVLCRSCHGRRHKTRAACALCGKPVKGHGYCGKHYQRWKKYGDPRAFKRNQHTALVRLED